MRGSREAKERRRRSAFAEIAKIQLTDRLQIKVALARWGDEGRADLRTWFRTPDARWLPTKRGVTVPVALLGELEAAVRALRSAYEAGALPTLVTELPTAESTGSVSGS
jgi:hypothetical protein